MPRIPYVYPAAGESEVGDRIRARRGEQGLLPIDGMLVNAPEVARGYNELVGAIRGKTEIADMLRELLALRVLALNNCLYEWKVHEPLGRAAGLTPAQISAISNTSTTINAAASRRDVFPPLLAAALDFCDASSIHVKVPQSVFDSLKEHLSAKEMVEVTAIVGVFHLISRFCVALDVAEVGEEDVPTIEV
ncbi:carboxymuconolactone decarboxylase [Mycena alexandri]|uniref:Carboxymuconolactone decarboxylase n=1 Tax=Mycena alexandri TaxID=1745969 RepID=A0AAD6SZY2_9AGAR|nr:carboxymuconolactone decarboxylase [Mycena alexandri]